MSWRKEQRRAERGYHHGNLKEALLQAALGDSRRRPGGVHLRRRARSAGVSPRARTAFSRSRRTAFEHRAARLRAVRGSVDPGLGRGRPDTVTAFERVGKAYLAFARAEPAFYSAMFESGLPVDLNPALLAASERAFGIIPGRRRALSRTGAPGMPTPTPCDIDHICSASSVRRRGMPGGASAAKRSAAPGMIPKARSLAANNAGLRSTGSPDSNIAE